MNKSENFNMLHKEIKILTQRQIQELKGENIWILQKSHVNLWIYLFPNRITISLLLLIEYIKMSPTKMLQINKTINWEQLRSQESYVSGCKVIYLIFKHRVTLDIYSKKKKIVLVCTFTIFGKIIHAFQKLY